MALSPSADLIRDIKDPEHPHTLEELNVVSEDCITVRHHISSSTGRRVLGVSCALFCLYLIDLHSLPFYILPVAASCDSQTQQHSSSSEASQQRHSSETKPSPTSDTSKETEAEEEEEEELWIKIVFTPTVPHCSLATLIGLCLRVKLERCLETRFKLDITVSEGTHTIEGDVNKQINDKERVAAAMENPGLREMVEECIKEMEY